MGIMPASETPFLPGAVIFDMDGLMLDTEQPVMDLWPRAARNLGWEMHREIVLRTIGIDENTTKSILRETYGENFPYFAIKKELFRLIHEIVDKEGIAHRPGLLTMLDKLDTLGVPFGVATSTDRKTALWKLEKANIRDRFNIIICGDEVQHGKPAPDIFLLAAKQLDQAPTSCIGFEDSIAGLRALAAAGIRSVFIKDLLDPPAEVLATVWRQCGDLAEAAELFG
ncbi:phosphorylated carbohydrates phosphatase [Spirochaetia bacterium]|nr:phosphorylated carbohydrates phosphatase [Spirochaetia bacterium]